MHPSITINNSTFTNSTGETLALSICQAYREAPDECELAWKVSSFGNFGGDDSKYEGLATPHELDSMFEEGQGRKADSFFGSWHLYAIIGTILVCNFTIMLYVRCRMKN